MSITIEQLIEKVKSYHPITNPQPSSKQPVDTLDAIHRAYTTAERAHRGQCRSSGEPYIQHPLAVAWIITELRLDISSVCAGLLHDCVEDTNLTIEEITQEFGKEIAFLVDGVTKLGQMGLHNRQERQAENFRKMLLAMAKDIRVILIKLCDRLDNVRTLFALPDSKQQRIAQETMDIYAPLAHRLGIQWVKTELEDCAFRSLYPKEYDELQAKVRSHFADRPLYIQKVEKIFETELLAHGIESTVTGRPKHLWSIYQKTVKTGHPMEKLYDIIGFRAIVPSVRDCYGALGAIHGKWTPIPGRFKDFIALPKPNRYQSLHTTVVGPYGERIEIQLRTPEMHRVAEEGIAAHWKYKEGLPDQIDGRDEKTFSWLHQLMEWQRTLKDPTEFIETVKVELFEHEVFAFTPQGDVKVLPQGATPVDFAYAVHTQVGHRCSGARINGVMVPLHSPLKNGDTVEILTHATHRPNKDWLRFVVSSTAKEKIRSALRSEQRVHSRDLGKTLLEQECKRHGISFKEKEKSGELLTAAQAFHIATLDDLFMNIGYGKVLASELVGTMTSSRPDHTIPKPHSLPKQPQVFSSSGIKVAGEENILVRFAKCCSPVSGDPILGVITRGRGVTIHSKICQTAQTEDEARRIEVQWDEHTKISRPVSIQIHCSNRPGLLSQLSSVFHHHGLDISQANCRALDNQHAVNTFVCRVKDVDQLSALLRDLKQINNVESVERL